MIPPRSSAGGPTSRSPSQPTSWRAADSGAPLALSDPAAASLETIAELAAGLEDRLLRAVGRNPAGGLARKAPA